MENSFQRLAPFRGKAKALLLSVFALSVFALSVFPSGASAADNEYSGATLPGHSWTTGNGVFLTNEHYISARAETTSSVCVGPVTYNGTYQMPYGWGCAAGGYVAWEFSPIYAAAGIYNPNPGTFHNYHVVAAGS